MDFLQRNLFIQLRSENFDSKDEMEPMTSFKKQKISQMMKNLDQIPSGEVLMNSRFLNRRLINIQNEERHAIDTSVETIYLLRLIVSNVNAMLANGINLRGIIQLGKYLRTRGDKVDFMKLESWLYKLHIQRMAQLEGSILIIFFDFEKDELPFVHHVERGAYGLTIRSLYYNIQDQQSNLFTQTKTGFIHIAGGTMLQNLHRSMRYLEYAPIETISNFINKIFSSLSNIEE